MYGCRVVQKIVENYNKSDRRTIYNEIKNQLAECIVDQNANHVIQKFVEKGDEEIVVAIIKIARTTRKRPAHWQKYVSEKPSLIQLLIRWIRSEINSLVLPAVQIVHSLFITEVKMKENLKETEMNEIELINKDLKGMEDIRKKIGKDIVECRGISDVIRMIGYDRNDEVRQLLSTLFKIIYRDSEDINQKRLWGFFTHVFEHPQSDVLNKEFISTVKLFALINENVERKLNLPIYIDTSI